MKINLLEIPVFYINMSKDKHKKKHIEQQISDLGFKNVTRINAVEDKKLFHVHSFLAYLHLE